MPELPEVETIVRDLNKSVKGLKITGVWADRKKVVKEPKNFEEFEKKIKGEKILKAHRRAKYILLDLTHNKTLIIHQKISGHLLYGKWQSIKGKWIAKTPGPLRNDPENRFIRFILFLSNGKMLALCDLRRFAKVLLVDTPYEELPEMKKLGPEPLSKDFNFNKFKEAISRKKGKIKAVLMDQTVIAGIGNIYSDEILWYARINPTKRVEILKDAEIKKIFKAMKKVFNIAINAKGNSSQDYRRLSGELGSYQYRQVAYQRTGEKCKRNDGGIIKRIKIGGRSAHYCPVCQY